MFCKKYVLKNFTKFSGKHLCQSLLLKKRLWHRCFPVNFVKFLRTPYSTKHLQWLLLEKAFRLNVISPNKKCSNTRHLIQKLSIDVVSSSNWNVYFPLTDHSFQVSVSNTLSNTLRPNICYLKIIRVIHVINQK